MKQLNLTPKQAKVLKELLSLDMDRIGFNDSEQNTLSSIYDGLWPSKRTSTPQVAMPIQIMKANFGGQT